MINFGGTWVMLKDEKSPHVFPRLSVFILLKGEERAAWGKLLLSLQILSILSNSKKKILWLGSFINWWLVGCILAISNRFTGDKCFWMYTVSHPPILEFRLFRKLGQRMKVQFPLGKPSPCFHNRGTWLLSICSRDRGLVRSYQVTHRIHWVLKSLPSLLRICS